MQKSADKQHKKPEQKSRYLPVTLAHADKLTLHIIFLSLNTLIIVPGVKRSFLVCALAKCCKVHVKQLKEADKKGT